MRLCRKKARFDTEEDARRARDEWVQQRRRRVIQRDDGQSLAGFLRAWLEDHKTEVKATTWQGYEEIVRLYLLPELGHVPLTSLDPSTLRGCFRRLAAQGKSPSRIGAVRRVLRSALTCARRDRLVDENVAMLVEPPKQHRPAPVFFTNDEVGRILAAATADRLGAFAVMALGTGLRRGELCGLRWENVDLDGRVAHVVEQVQRVKGQGLVITSPKSDKSRRVVPLPSFVVDALRAHRVRQAGELLRAGPLRVDTGRVFTTAHGATIDPRNALRAFYGVLDAASVPRRKLHATRHTTATHLAAMNVPRAVTRDLMGHTDSRTTDLYYTHTVREQLHAAAGVLDSLSKAK